MRMRTSQYKYKYVYIIFMAYYKEQKRKRLIASVRNINLDM